MKKIAYVLALAVASATLPSSCTKESLTPDLYPQEHLSAGADDRSSNTTGQSIQVNLDFDQQNYQITEEGTWSYNYNGKPAALAAYDTYFELPVTSGGPSASQIETAKLKAFQDNNCNFYHGNALVAVTTTFGSKSVTCTPKAPGQYAAETGWTFVGNVSTVDVNLSNIYVSSLSWLGKDKKSGGWQKKNSFTMTNAGVSRLEGLTVELLRETEDGDVVVATYNPEHTVALADWTYSSTGEYYGDAGAADALAAAEGASVNATHNNAYDDFKGNNSSLGERAEVANQSFTNIGLGGHYKVRIAGTIKGNGFDTNHGFSITKTVVVTGGCN